MIVKNVSGCASENIPNKKRSLKNYIKRKFLKFRKLKNRYIGINDDCTF